MNRLVIASMLSVAGLGVAASGQTIVKIASPYAGFDSSLFLDSMSADGSVLAGQITRSGLLSSTGGVYRPASAAFTEVGAQTGGNDANATSILYDVTSDGTWAVGYAGTTGALGPGLLYNTETGQKITLPHPAGASAFSLSRGYGVSNNAARIVGKTSVGGQLACSWTFNGTVASTPTIAALPIQPAGVTVTSSELWAVSGDGTTVLGTLTRGGASSGTVAFVNNTFPSGTPVVLPDLAGGTDVSFAQWISGNGNTVLGQVNGTVNPGQGNEFTGACGAIWTRSAGVWTLTQAVAPIGGTSMIFKAASADSSRVFGEAPGGDGTAVIWTSTGGAQSLFEVAQAAGVDFASAGITGLNSVEDCSADGTIILGRYSGGVYLLTLPATNACPNLSNVAGPNQSTTPDDALTADDIIVFLGWFFANDSRANVAGPNQSTIPDNSLTADDIIVFLGRYFSGC